MVHVELVTGEMLIVPDDFTRIRIQGERRVRVQEVSASDFSAPGYRGVGAGDSGAPVHEIELRVVRSRHPG